MANSNFSIIYDDLVENGNGSTRPEMAARPEGQKPLSNITNRGPSAQPFKPIKSCLPIEKVIWPTDSAHKSENSENQELPELSAPPQIIEIPEILAQRKLKLPAFKRLMKPIDPNAKLWHDALHYHHSKECYLPVATTRSLTGFDQARREVLIEFLVNICEYFKYSNEVLHSTVFQMDRCLITPNAPNNLMMAAIVLKLVASLAESRLPTWDEVRELAGENAQDSELNDIENEIKALLGRDLRVSTEASFLVSLSYELPLATSTYHLCCYICEVGMYVKNSEHPLLPSVVAAASIAYARYMLGMPIWSRRLKEVTKLQLKSLKNAILWLSRSCASIKDDARACFLTKKYNSAEYDYVGGLGSQLIGEKAFEMICMSYEGRGINPRTEEVVLPFGL